MIEIEKLTFDAASQRTKDANGYLRVASSHITKECICPYYGREIPGYVDLHLDPDRIYYGYRPGDELVKAAATFNGLPLLFEHHAESAANPQKDFRVGSLGTDAVYAAPYLDNSLIFTDQAAIDAVERDEYRELSSAYRYAPDFTPGEFQGVPYDFAMRNIVGNHVAIVREGRTGPDVVVADAQISQGLGYEQGRSNSMDKIMELFGKITSLFSEYGIAPASAAEAEDEEQQERQELDAKRTEAQEKFQKLMVA